jgi:hypothetical protein
MLAVYNPTQVHCILTLGQILSISIYIQWGNQHEAPFGKRAIVYQGLADLERIKKRPGAFGDVGIFKDGFKSLAVV